MLFTLAAAVSPLFQQRQRLQKGQDPRDAAARASGAPTQGEAKRKVEALSGHSANRLAGLLRAALDTVSR